MYKITPHQDGDLLESGVTKYITLAEEVTVDKLIEYGFTNRHKPRLSFGRMLSEDVSLSVVVDVETLKITRIDVLDDDFCQPYNYQSILATDSTHTYARKVFDGVDKWLTRMQEDGIIKGYTRGMYV